MLMLPRQFMLTMMFVTSALATVVDPLIFKFKEFSPSEQNLTYSGNASPYTPLIQLTTNLKKRARDGSFGRVAYSKPLHLWDDLADFSVDFTFIIDSQTNVSYGDGLAFFMVPVDFPSATEQEGRGLGLVSGEQVLNSSKYPFVAVEFDTFQNKEWDPPYDHVGININSMNSVKQIRWWSNVRFGKTNRALVTYNGSTQNLSVTFSGFQGDLKLKQTLSYVVDLRSVLPASVSIGFSAATGSYFETHTLNSWSFTSTLLMEESFTANRPSAHPKSTSNHKKSLFALELGAIFGLLAIIFMLVVIWYFRWRKRVPIKRCFSVEPNLSVEFKHNTGPRKFSYDMLAEATKNFSEDEKLGEGGFGGVYRGFLQELNSYVAVKKISRTSKQGIKEYSSEVRIISRLRHKNLVQLMGWCHENNELLLVYELMPNGSLDSHLFSTKNSLTWNLRYKIASGLASALLYLHEDWEQGVLHRDIKSSNIMLDSNFNAKLGDFGLARLVDHAKGWQTTVLAGTVGYLAPECLSTGKAGKESDVFSFGIVALEIACGRKSIDPEVGHTRLVNWVWDLYGTGCIHEATDPRLCGVFDENQIKCLMIVGLWCAHPDHKLRPSMRQAVSVLSFESPLPNLPPKIPVATYLSLPFDGYSSTVTASSSCHEAHKPENRASSTT